MKKVVPVLLFFGTCFFHSLICAQDIDLPVLDRIVAVVNKDAISESELNSQMQLLMMRLKQSEMTPPPFSTLKKQLLEKIILEKLQLQMAKESGIEIAEDQVDQSIKELAEKDKLSVEELKNILQEQGVEFAQFQKSIKTEMLISRLQQREIGQNISISPRDVELYMKTPGLLQDTGSEYRVAHILLPLPQSKTPEGIKNLEKEANKLVQELKNGADFAQYAMEKSKGPQALNGGDLGFRTVAELPSLFTKVVPELARNEIRGPIQNESGFHIIKLLDKRTENGAADPKAESDVLRNKAMDALFQRKFQDKLTTWLRRVRDNAEIQIYLNDT